ncbi:MAG: S1 RNA-binding domain-containing protein, partial [Methylobacterium sp.]
MANKMLIDASHPEETRVVVVKGNRIEEFDFESEHKKQIKGNIYLAKVTRVEPSLQAAFVEYGGNRHGFLAFSEIHPDYYQIPVADRQALIAEELARSQEEEEQDERRAAAKAARPPRTRRSTGVDAQAADAAEGETVSEEVETADLDDDHDGDHDVESDGEVSDAGSAQPGRYEDGHTDEASADAESDDEGTDAEAEASGERGGRGRRRGGRRGRGSVAGEGGDEEAEQVDEVGSEDAMEEVPVRNRQPRKQYKIQEVIKRRQ